MLNVRDREIQMKATGTGHNPLVVPLMVVMIGATLGLLVLAHLVQQGNDAENAKREYAYHTQGNGPSLAVVEALDHHHEAEDGDEDGNGKEGELHILCWILEAKIAGIGRI
jgi:hypothetical protein